MANYVSNETLNNALKKTSVTVKNYVDGKFQPLEDANLQTTDKTIVGAINELYQNNSNVDETLLENLVSEVKTLKVEIHETQEIVNSNKTEVTNIIELVDGKADIENVYTKEETDHLISDLNLSNYATIEQLNDVQKELEEIPAIYLTQEQAASTVERVKYEIVGAPIGTLVDYRDKEIRVMCPKDAKFQLQNTGANGDSSMYYMGFKAYAPSDDVVSFKEDDAEIISDDTMYYFEGNDFAGIDKYGRKYSIAWLALAKYDSESDTWSYFGSKSNIDRYIGWYYTVEWYNADGIMIASDQIRINLSNENCHNDIKPYYVNDMIKAANAYTDAQIESKIPETYGIEIVEF